MPRNPALYTKFIGTHAPLQYPEQQSTIVKQIQGTFLLM